MENDRYFMGIDLRSALFTLLGIVMVIPIGITAITLETNNWQIPTKDQWELMFKY